MLHVPPKIRGSERGIVPALSLRVLSVATVVPGSERRMLIGGGMGLSAAEFGIAGALA